MVANNAQPDIQCFELEGSLSITQLLHSTPPTKQRLDSTQDPWSVSDNRVFASRVQDLDGKAPSRSNLVFDTRLTEM